MSASLGGPLVALALVAMLAGCGEEPGPKLPALGAVPGETSVSGISSGAYMAGQFQVANARLVVGAAIIAGGPYGCAESLHTGLMPAPGAALLNLSKAVNGCMQNGLAMWGVPDPKALAEQMRERAARGEIDPADALTSDRVYLYTSHRDPIVASAIVEAAAAFYREAGVSPAAILLVESEEAGHAVVTESAGIACGRTGPPYVTDCDYDQAGALLGHIYGKLEPPSAERTGELLPFDQQDFARGLPSAGLAAEGRVYVPKGCRSPGCRVHIAFHGCAQSRASVGDAFIEGSGFLRWADTNRLIVLFPEVDASAFNPQGCWDWWGYTGRDFLSRSAPQIVAVRRMVERLASR